MAEGRKTIVILLAVLLALVAVGGAIVFLLPDDTTTPPTQSPSTVSTPQRLDLSALERSDYTQLDTSLLQQGALPVLPPATVGKANPFL